MAENYVEVTVAAKDDTGPGFAKAEAETKAFEATVTKSFASQARAAKLLNDPLVAATQDTERWQKATLDAAGTLRVLKDGVEQAASKQGFLRTAMNGVASALNGGGKQGLLPGLFGAAGAAEKAGTSLGTMGTIIVPLIGLVATLATALMPFIAGLALVTVGVGTFAALAIPEISKVIQARQALSAAETKYDLAKTAAQRKSALQAEAAATAGLSSQQKELMKPLGELSGMFSRLQRAVQPEVMRAFGSAIRIIRDLLPAIRPLAIGAGKAIDGFLKQIDGWLRSSSGQKFIKWMEVDGPKAMAVFGRYLWDVTKAAGRTFDFLYNTGVTFDHRWGIFWHTAAHVVDSFRTGFVQMGRLIAADASSIWHSVATVTDNFVRGFQQLGHEILFTIDGVVRGFQQMGSLIAGVWDSLVGTISGAVGKIESIISGLNSALGGVPGKILSLLGVASGGIVGAATGGLHSGLRMVGEYGPELVQLPSGSRVYNAGQTAQMLAGAGGGGGQFTFTVDAGGASAFEQFMLQAIRNWVRVKGGGNVQRAFGSPNAA